MCSEIKWTDSCYAYKIYVQQVSFAEQENHPLAQLDHTAIVLRLKKSLSILQTHTLLSQATNACAIVTCTRIIFLTWGIAYYDGKIHGFLANLPFNLMIKFLQMHRHTEVKAYSEMMMTMRKINC